MKISPYTNSLRTPLLAGSLALLCFCALSGGARAQDTLGARARLEGQNPGSDSVVLDANPSNPGWSAAATSDATDWLTLTPPAGGPAAATITGTGSGNVVFNFAANPSSTRSGTITFSMNDGTTLTLNVTQAGSTYLPASDVGVLASAGKTPEPSSAAGVAVDTVGNVFFTGAGVGMVYEWSWPSGPTSPLASSAPAPSFDPVGVAVDAYGNVYIADAPEQTVWQWTPGGAAFTPVISSIAVIGDLALYLSKSRPYGQIDPVGVAVDAAGNVYIADNGNKAIEELVLTAPGTLAGASIEVLATSGMVPSGLSSSAFDPVGVAVDAAGNVYIADAGNRAIEEWMPTSPGSLSLFFSSSSSLLSASQQSSFNPVGVAVDGAGNVYIVDAGNYAIWEVVAATSFVNELVSPEFNLPQGAAVDAGGNLYMAEAGPVELVIEEEPYAFVDTTGKTESARYGTDTLSPVLTVQGTSLNLTGPFAPASDSTSWLRIMGTSPGAVDFGFNPNNTGTTRSGNLVVLGVEIPVEQNYNTPGFFTTGVAEPVNFCGLREYAMLYWWPLQFSLIDIWGANNATPQGPSGGEVDFMTGTFSLPVQASIAGDALYFDGQTFLSTLDEIPGPQNFTLDLWFETTSTNGGVLIGFSSYQTGTGGGDSYDRVLYMDPSGYLHFGIWSTTTGSAQTADAPEGYWCNDGLWHHVAATYDTAEGVTMILDGGAPIRNLNGTGAENYTGYWRIGEDNLNNWPYTPPGNGLNLPLYYQGAMAQVSIYSPELGPEDILFLYLDGALPTCVPQSCSGVTGGQTATVTAPPTSTTAGVTATVTDGTPGSSETLTVTDPGTIAPPGYPALPPNSVYCDIQDSGETASDSITANFYCPDNGGQYPTLKFYNTVTAGWENVLPIATEPANLVIPDAISLGGTTADTWQYTVVFNAGSQPPVTGLTGTEFALATAPTTAAVTWASPGAITYGTALSGAQLDATANLPGNFVYDPPAGTVLSAGWHFLSVTFTPSAPGVSAVKAVATITVKPAPLKVVADGASKTYGQTLFFDGTKGFTTKGLVNGDTVTGALLTSRGAPAWATVAGSPYAVDVGWAVGRGLHNYIISYVPGSLTVNPAALTITADNRAKPYGQTLVLGTKAFTAKGLLNRDTVTRVALTSPGTVATAAPGTYAIVPSNAQGTGLANYKVSYADGTLTVTKTVH
jgi:sugar lactone lactonase YvrE